MERAFGVIAGLQKFITPVHSDDRGHFLETFRQTDIPRNFVQDNESYSRMHTLRGLHFQKEHPQAKLVRVVVGKILDVVVDIRPASSTFGDWTAIELNGATGAKPVHSVLYIPAGCAHGFLTIDTHAIVQYKCADYYFPHDQHGIRWDDPDLHITWDKYCSLKEVIVSKQDNAWPSWGATRKELINEREIPKVP